MSAATDTAYLRFLTAGRDDALAVHARGEEVPAGPTSPVMTPEARQNAIDVVRAWTGIGPIPRTAYEGVKLPYGVMVHVTHCCLTHGCKYGSNKPCAVARGYFQQDHPCEQCDEDLEDAREGYGIALVNLVGPENKSLAARVRKIADGPNPWIPGAQADLIREIATELETLQKIREILNG